MAGFLANLFLANPGSSTDGRGGLNGRSGPCWTSDHVLALSLSPALFGLYVCGLPQLGQNFPVLGIGLPHSMQNLVPGAAAGAASAPPLADLMLFIMVWAMPSET